MLDNLKYLRIAKGELNMAPNVETCPICGNKTTNFSISENSLRFLEQRLHEKALDEAITLSNIAWNNFPGLRLTADSKAVINGLLTGIQDQVNGALKPLNAIIKIICPLNKRLEELIGKLPEDVKKEFGEINIQLTDELKSILEAAKNSTQPVQRDVKELSDAINLLINKPLIKGTVNEETLKLSWQEVFVKDKTFKKGGAGQPDLVVVPYFEFNGARFGQKIVVERKSGKQKYSGNHLQEAIQHTKAEGSGFCVLVYDSPANLLELQKPIYLTMADGITIGITDVETGGWKVARQVFEVIQAVMPNSETNGGDMLDIAKLQRTVEEMHGINSQIELLRKNNNSAISNCEKVRETINKFEELISNYQQKLKELFSAKNPPRVWQSEKPIQTVLTAAIKD